MLLNVSYDRCVNSRWKPIEIPSVVSAYPTAKMTRSRQVTYWPQRKKIDARKPANGIVTPSRFVIF